ncbi:hypothetical protein [Desulfitobacterium sp.]|uniref:hypothetical protein n=1 Tax=Desulfitobacterium sp. TaxID=49981 RepID=UPI002C376CAF|nr:hypothetical protein [Desulfitobacterium sp.]HVJ50192.1 hypothetical protein [Desulfitobacterium sp.]
MKMLIAKITGLLAAFGSMILVIILLYFNPYSSEKSQFGTMMIVYTTLFAPALFALICLIIKRYRLMFIPFIWSLPISLYLGLTPGVFSLIMLTCILYLISALLFLFNHKSK